MQPAQGTRLDSWKAIAEYLDRNVRTVTRWADERGMPIHHVPGKKRGAVFAFTIEIDAWLVEQKERDDSRSSGIRSGAGTSAELSSLGTAEEAERTAVPDNFQESSRGWGAIFLRALQRRIAVPVVLVAMGAAAISTVLPPVNRRGPELVSLEYGADTVEGKSADGHTMWVHRYPQQLAEDYLKTQRPPSRVLDFFGDGGREAATIVPLRTGPNPTNPFQPQVDFFTSAGKVLWSYLPQRGFRFGEHDLKGPWHLQDLLVTEESGQQTLWVVATHHLWGNSFVVQLDPRTGKDTLRFVNTGSIRRLSEVKAAQGTYLLAGGFNNEWDSGSLAITKEDRPFAASPQTPGSRHYCDSCRPGVTDYYFVFPRSEINRTAGAYEDSVREISVAGEGLEISKLEALTDGRELTIYLLRREPPFSVISLRYNSDYDRLHRAWSVEGKLNHSLENCPERLHPQPVRLWTPATGWTELPVKPAKANQ